MNIYKLHYSRQHAELVSRGAATVAAEPAPPLPVCQATVAAEPVAFAEPAVF